MITEESKNWRAMYQAIVGIGRYRMEQDKLVFTEFAMSCRVARKYVESVLFTSILQSENCIIRKFEILIMKKDFFLRNIVFL